MKKGIAFLMALVIFVLVFSFEVKAGDPFYDGPVVTNLTARLAALEAKVTSWDAAAVNASSATGRVTILEGKTNTYNAASDQAAWASNILAAGISITITNKPESTNTTAYLYGVATNNVYEGQ